MRTTLLSLVAILLLSFASRAQLLNGDFEDLNDTLPADWQMDDFGSGLKTSYKQSGDYALAVWNWYYYAKGFVVNGNTYASLFGDMPGSGTPTAEKALRLTGYYYYDTTGTDTNADTAFLSIAYRKWDPVNNLYDTVAYGIQYFLPTTGQAMAPFSLPIDDWEPGVAPDTMLITIVSSLNGFCDASGGGNCLYLYIDNLRLETTTGTQEVMGQFKELTMHPNPATHTINVTSGVDGAVWNLYNLSGKHVQQTTLRHGENQVDVSAHPAGMYIATLQQNGITIGRQKLLKQ